MKEELNENLKNALDYMFYFIGEACPKNVSYYKKDGWFRKHSWTEKTQEKYTEWLSDYLKKNWQGITERKLTSKKDRDKAAEMFVFNYGFKLRPLTIKDFTPLIPEGQLKEIMSKRELEIFNKWAFGSTMSPHGYYKWDVESFLNGISRNID